MDYIERMLTDFAWKLDEYYSGNEYPWNIQELVEEFLTDYNPYEQPERLNPKTSKEDVIVRTSDESGRDDPEAVCPPGDRS